MSNIEDTGRTHPGYQLSDIDRRSAEMAEQAWPVLAKFVAGTEPAQILTDLSTLAATIEHAAQSAGARLTRKPEHEAERMVRAMFRKDTTGLGLVTINTDPDKAHRAQNWAGLESDPEWCPVIGFAEITPTGIVARALPEHRWPMVAGERRQPVAVAVMVRPQVLHAERVTQMVGDEIVIDYRTPNGLIYPKPIDGPDGTEWLPGCEVVGIVRAYASIEEAEADRDALTRAVEDVTRAMRPATEPDGFEVEDDGPTFQPIG